ncbi:MAG: hypothetical protein U9N73_12560 [Candidatus Auribacterota bacterium]|nr:hypothetical protein [Candidatus Auribacterota bacterium]
MFIIGFISCLVVIGIIGIIMMPRFGKFFFVKDVSSLNFEDTLEAIRKNNEKNDKGWFITTEKDYNLTYQKKGKGELPFRLVEFKIGNANHSYPTNKAFPALATFMPSALAVVEYPDGNVVIYRKNTGLLGRFFSGVVRKVMTQEVPTDMEEILKGAI